MRDRRRGVRCVRVRLGWRIHWVLDLPVPGLTGASTKAVAVGAEGLVGLRGDIVPMLPMPDDVAAAPLSWRGPKRGSR